MKTIKNSRYFLTIHYESTLKVFLFLKKLLIRFFLLEANLEVRQTTE